MPYPMYTSIPTQSVPNFHTESRFSGFDMPAATQAATGRPASTYSGSGVSAPKRRRFYFFGFGKMWAGIRKKFASKPKAARPATVIISTPFDVMDGDHPMDAATFVRLGVRPTSSYSRRSTRRSARESCVMHGALQPPTPHASVSYSAPYGASSHSKPARGKSLKYSGVSKPSTRTRPSTTPAAKKQARKAEMAAKYIKMPIVVSEYEPLDIVDAAAALPADADVRAARNDIAAARNDVAAAFDEIEIQDVTMSDIPTSPASDHSRVPSLNYISYRSPSIELEAAMKAAMDSEFAPAPSSPVVTSAAVKKNRDDALAALEGYRAMPASFSSQPHPISLSSGPRYTDTKGQIRVSGTKYQAYASPPTPTYMEGPESYECYRPTAKWEGHGKVGGYNYVPDHLRPDTPASFASTHRHSQYVSRVESGVFDGTASAYRLVTPTPACLVPGDRTSSWESGQTFLDFDSAVAPPQPVPAVKRKPSKITKDRNGHKTTVPRKSVPTPSAPAPPARKPVHSAPAASAAPSTPPSGHVPSRYAMNDNGFPKANLRSAEARYSATPSYQARTVDSVEAKFQKETRKDSATAAQTPPPPPFVPSLKQVKAERKAAEKKAKDDKRVAKKAAKKQKSAKEAERISREIGLLLG